MYLNNRKITNPPPSPDLINTKPIKYMVMKYDLSKLKIKIQFRSSQITVESILTLTLNTME